MQPIASLSVASGATAVSTSTTAAQVNVFSATGGAVQYDGNAKTGNASVIPDQTNNRIKVSCPGVYRVTAQIAGVVTGTNDYVLQVRKNGTALGDLRAAQQIATTTRGNLQVSGLVVVTASDIQTADGGTFADPSTTTAPYAGGGGAPEIMAHLDLCMSNPATTGSFTVESGSFVVERMDG